MVQQESIAYLVKKGDSLSKIVKKHGFPVKDWERIYYAEFNKGFRRLRKDPNLIQPGDVFRLPRYARQDYWNALQWYMTANSKLNAMRGRDDDAGQFRPPLSVGKRGRATQLRRQIPQERLGL